MRIGSWLKNWPRRRNSFTVIPTVSAHAEYLENRSLLSSSALIVGTELNIQLDTNQNLRVGSFNGNVLVEISSNGGLLTPLGSLGSVPASSIQSIVITGGDLENNIDLSTVLAANFTSLTSINVNAGNGDDSITGSNDFADNIAGGDGNDTIDGQGGDDALNGGDGADVIRGGAGNDNVLGGDGSDSITTDAGDDTVDAGNGSDVVDLGDGNDSLFAGNGDDAIQGGDGNDTLNGDGGTDTVDGGAGDDSILGGELHDSLNGGAGNDTINGQAGNDTIDGQAGDDSLLGGIGNDSLVGADGDDFVNGNAGNDTISGNVGDDTILGGNGDDLLDGNEGNDSVLGQAGNDTLSGSSGADLLRGGDGNDLINGGLPQLFINDVAVAEGNSGTTNLQFTVTLSAASRTPVTVDFTTVNGSANTGSDFTANFGTLTFAVGVTTQTITISVISDTTVEADETLFVTLSNAVGADLLTAVGQGTIVNDDTAPVVTQVLYAVDGASQQLYSIDPVTAVATLIGSTGVGLTGLTSAPNGTLYGETSNQVFTVNPTTGATTLFLNLGAAVINEGDLGYDAATNQMFGIDFGTSSLIQIDTVGLTATNLGAVTVGGVAANTQIDWDGLTYRGSTAYGYVGPRGGNTGLANHLFTLDTTTRAVTDVGLLTGVNTLGFAGDIAYDSALDVFYLMTRNPDGNNGDLYRVDPTTAVATLIGNTGIGDAFGLAVTGSASTPPVVVVVPPPSVPAFTASNDSLFGDAGNDTLFGSSGDDLLNGGLGNDSMDGGGGNDSMLGGGGNDTLLGNIGDDTLNGQGGTDSLDGGEGHDTIVWEGAGSGNDTLGDTVGDNTLLVNGNGASNVFSVGQDANGLLTVSELGKTVTVGPTFNSVILNSGSGDDTVNVGDLSLVNGVFLSIQGGVGDDLLSAVGSPIGNVRLIMDGGDGNDTVLGGLDDETLLGSAGTDSLNGGAGNDTLNGGTGNDTVDGGTGNDSVDGGSGQDILLGNAGNDIINGGVGDDTISGGADNDTLNGNAGDDSLLGLSGNDSLLGGNGLDTLGGGDGNDTLDGGFNDDLLVGGVGDDKIRGNHGNDTISGDDGHDTINGGDGNDSILAGLGNDLVDGADGDDIVNGGAGNDILVGGDGKDTIRGGGGSDVLLGQDGDDNIDGQSGADTVAGNQGVDVINEAIAEINEAFTLSMEILDRLNAV